METLTNGNRPQTSRSIYVLIRKAGGGGFVRASGNAARLNTSSGKTLENPNKSEY
jgi:hypothetical protein